MEDFTMEIKADIYNEKCRTVIEVRPDADGLGAFEIVQRDINGKGVVRLFIVREEAVLLVDALRHVLAHNPRATSE